MDAQITNPHVARQRILEAQAATGRVQQKRLEEAAESYRAYRDFFNRLALLAGGTVALSVTYLGYLKTLATQPVHLWLLIASWIVLVVCLVCASFYAFFHTGYVSYARTAEFAQRLKEQHELIAEEVRNVPVLGIETKGELEEYIGQCKKLATAREKDVRWSERRARIFEITFRIAAGVASIGFVVGLILLLIFAVVNIHLPAKQSQAVTSTDEYRVIGRSERNVTDSNGTHAVVDYVLEHNGRKIYANCDVASIGNLDPTASCAFRPLHAYQCELQSDNLSKESFPISDLKCKDAEGRNVYLYVTKEE